jgi:hypothetical protein
MAPSPRPVKSESQRDGLRDMQEGWTGMIRFLVGAACGAGFMYWFLTGDLPWSDEALRWLSDNATSYSGRARE